MKLFIEWKSTDYRAVPGNGVQQSATYRNGHGELVTRMKQRDLLSEEDVESRGKLKVDATNLLGEKTLKEEEEEEEDDYDDEIRASDG
jgi:hypothetical protein